MRRRAVVIKYTAIKETSFGKIPSRSCDYNRTRAYKEQHTLYIPIVLLGCCFLEARTPRIRHFKQHLIILAQQSSNHDFSLISRSFQS